MKRAIYIFTHWLKKYLLFSFFFLPFLTGCATKTTPVFVTLKSPQIKIADEGFLKQGLGYKELTIYKAGSVPVSFLIKNNVICINNQCVNKYLFMKKYFPGLSKNFFDIILQKKPLSLKSYKKTNNGFIQKSKNIFYLVNKNSVLFKDKKNKITIFIKYLKDKK